MDRFGRAARAGTLGILVLGVCSFPAGGDSLSGSLEVVGSKEERRTQAAAGPAEESSVQSLFRRLSLNFEKSLWPNLVLQGGGFFEQRDDTVEPGSLETSLWKSRPFLILRLRTPMYLAEAGFNRSEEEQKTGSRTTLALVREVYSGILGWQPVGFPQFKLQAIETKTYDRTRTQRDTREDFLLLTSRFRPFQPLELFYRGTFERIEDRIKDSQTRSTVHNARLLFNQSWWNRRATLSSDYNVTRRETEILQKAGEARFPVFPLAGLSSADDTPEEGPLDPNPGLIDENLLSGAGINIGLPPVGGDTRPRNIGLDLGTDNPVNTLLVLVDRELPLEIVERFSFDLYTSPDNLRWTRRRQGLAPLWDPFRRVMEVQFDQLRERYVKLAVAPLSPGGQAADYPDILVTELQAILRLPADQVEGRTTSTNHIYNLNFRARLLEAPLLFYEMSYFLSKAGGNPAATTLSNGFSFQHAFHEIYTLSGRVSREDGRRQDEGRLAYFYTTVLGVNPLPTLRANLQFNGKRETVGGRQDDNDSVYLFTGAELYKGVDANIGVGRSSSRAPNGAENDSTQINLGASVIPHPALTINVSLQGRSENIRGGGEGIDGKRTNRNTEGSLSFRPLPTLFLYAALRQEQRTGFATQMIRNLAASWSPFPDGALRFNFRYDETYRSESATKERVISPALRWNISPRMYLDLAFQRLTQSTLQQETTTDIISAIFRVTF